MDAMARVIVVVGILFSIVSALIFIDGSREFGTAAMVLAGAVFVVAYFQVFFSKSFW